MTKETAAAAEKEGKYWRAGIALPIERKPEFDRRMAALGLKTLGDLSVFFTQATGIVEALAPVAKEFSESRTRMTPEKRKGVIAQLAVMSTEEIQKLIDDAGLKMSVSPGA